MLKHLNFGIVLMLVLISSLLLNACGGSAVSEKTYQVGVFFDPESLAHRSRLDGLKDGMKALGYEDGKTINYVETVVNDPAQEETLLKEMSAKNYDAYISFNTSAGLRLKKFVTQKPIIVTAMPDAVTIGAIKSSDQPGTNMTGVDNLNVQLSARRLELLKQLVPSLKTVYLVFTPGNKVQGAHLASVREAATKLGITLIDKPIATKDDCKKNIPQLKASEAEGVLPMGLNMYSLCGEDFKELIPREKLVMIGLEKNNLNSGALFSYGANNYELGKQNTDYLYKVLHGSDPATLPVQQVNKIEYIVNQKLADQIGRKLSDELIKSADEIVK